MDVWLDCIKNVAVIVLLSYPLTKYSQLKRAFFLSSTHLDRWTLSIFFGLLSILSMMLGTEIFNGASLDSRNVSPTVGGILAGKMVGTVAGIIGASYRLASGGFTAVPDAIALPLCGLLGGFIYQKFGHQRFNFYTQFCVGLAVEAFHKGLVLLLAQPYILAESLISWIGWATMLVNGLGVVIFVNLLRDIQYSQYVTGTSYAVKAFTIAEQTLPIVKEELDAATAANIASIIYEEADVDAVAITVNGKILAFQGVGADHHKQGHVAIHQVTGDRDETGQLVATYSKYRCLDPLCSLKSLIVAPLTSGSTHLGTLEIYKIRDVIFPPDIKMVTSIARVLSMQFFNARASMQENLLVRAEYEALRAQIHPHFLFNALSVIKVFIREEPQRAQELLVTLAHYLRRSFGTRPDLIPFAEEIKGVRFYLDIQQARFGKRLQVAFDIADDTKSIPFPAFGVQPLVENAMNHGFIENSGSMNLLIRASLQQQSMVVEVIDNGCGISDEVIDAVRKNTTIQSMGVGLTNIHRRLRILYGSSYEFRLIREQPGTRVLLRIPLLADGGHG